MTASLFRPPLSAISASATVLLDSRTWRTVEGGPRRHLMFFGRIQKHLEQLKVPADFREEEKKSVKKEESQRVLLNICPQEPCQTFSDVQPTQPNAGGSRVALLARPTSPQPPLPRRRCTQRQRRVCFMRPPWFSSWNNPVCPPQAHGQIPARGKINSDAQQPGSAQVARARATAASHEGT